MIGKSRKEALNNQYSTKWKFIADGVLREFIDSYSYSSESIVGKAARVVRFVRGVYKLREQYHRNDAHAYLHDTMITPSLPTAFLGPLLKNVQAVEHDEFYGQAYTILYYKIGDMTVYFPATRESGNKPRIDGTAYIDCSKEFAAKFSRYIFNKYGDVVEIRVIGNSVEYISLPQADDYIGPYDEAYFDNYLRAFESKGLDRVLLFIGKPGTGKSTMARRIASLRGKRCVIAPTSLLTMIGEKVLNYFCTGVLVMEDLHLSVHHNPEMFLHFMENIQTKLNGTVLIGTASRIITIDEGAHRPGRFDDIFRFKVPEKKLVKRIMRHYADKFGCTDAYMKLEDFLLEQCKGLPPAYLKSVVQNIYALGDQPDIKERLSQKIEIAVRLVSPNRDEFEYTELTNGGLVGRAIVAGFALPASTDPFKL